MLSTAENGDGGIGKEVSGTSKRLGRWMDEWMDERMDE